MGLHRFGFVGLLLIVTALVAISTVPGAVGVVISDAGISPQGSGAVMVTVLDCAGNPVPYAVIQLRSLGWGVWIYTGPNGEATLSAPSGTYTLQGGYGAFIFSQTINVGTGVVAVTVRLGAGCSTVSSSSSATQTTYTSYTTIRPKRP